MEKIKIAESKINRTVILAVLVFSAFIGLFNETILNVALNNLMEEMKVTAGTVQWIITAYMIITSVMVPLTAFLIQSFETKKLYLSAMTLLLIGTIGSACSGSFVMLLISRMLQASGAGMMIPIMMNTVLIVTPLEKRGAAMGVCACAIQLGPAFGPTFSGVILQFYSWHALFFILIPLIILTMIFGYFYLVNVSTLTKPKIDIISIILSTIGFGGIIYGLNSFSIGGNILMISIISIIGVISLIIFGKRQLSLKEPMLEIRTFKFHSFSVGTALVMISMMTIFTMNVMLPIFLEGALKETTFVSAMVLLPATLTNGFVSLMSGRIYDKVGVKLLIPIGFAIILVSLFILSGSNINTSLIEIVVVYIVVCIGIGSTLSPAQTNALNQLPKKYYPHGVALLNTLQQISAAIGSSLFIGIMSSSELKALNNLASQEASVATGFKSAVLALEVFVLLGFLLSFIKRSGGKELSLSADLKSDDVKVDKV